jgi:hypothetical protein
MVDRTSGLDAESLDANFPRYTQFEPRVPVWCITPKLGRVIHRFYDTSPFSPSGRYVALTRLPYEDRLPRPGDVAEVVLIDLQTGREGLVAETRGWDTQLGAQVQWGKDDHELFFNDVDVKQWRPFGVKLDPLSGARQEMEGTIYNVSPDAKWSASPCLLRTARTQAGYGVIVPRRQIPVNRGAPENDGIYLTNLSTGESRLLLSIADMLERCKGRFALPDATSGDYYGFHSKWNPQGSRLLFILRWAPRKRGILSRFSGVPKSEMKKNVLTIETNVDSAGQFEARDVHVAISDEQWSCGGHHPNWCPDSERLLMNLALGGKELRFATARYDGSDLEPLNDKIVGSGHPTMHPSARYVLTDAYPNEPLAFGDGTIPIRLIDLQTGTDEHLLRINVRPAFRGGKKELRVDAHPAWDRTFTRIAFNACPDGTRRVYVADLQDFLNANERTQIHVPEP